MADEPSLGELTRDILRLTADIAALRVQLTQDVVLAKVYEADERTRVAVTDALKDRVAKLEDNESKIRFGNRAALVMALVAVLAAALSFAGAALLKG